MPRSISLLRSFPLLLIWSLASSAAARDQDCAPVAIDRIRPETAAAKIDLHLDDRLVSWKVEGPFDESAESPRQGRLCHWWQAYELEFTVSPHHRIELLIERDGQELLRILPADRWGLYVRPVVEEFDEHWRSQVRGQLAFEPDSPASSWLATRVAESSGELGRWLALQLAARSSDEPPVREAVERFGETSGVEQVALLDRLAEMLLLRRRPNEGLLASHRLIETVPSDSPLRPRVLFQRASLLSRRGARNSEVQRTFREALGALDDDPRKPTFLTRDIWKNFGVARGRSGDLAGAEIAFLESQKAAIAMGLGRDGGLLHNLGVVARRRGDTARALQYFREALELSPPGTRGRADTLVGLANLYKHTGSPLDALRVLAQLPEPPREPIEDHLRWVFQLAEAQREAGSSRRAQEILAPYSEQDREPLRGTTVGAYWTFFLGSLARDFGDTDQALEYYGRGIDQLEDVVPDSYEPALTRAKRAELLLELGREDEAFDEYLRACDGLDRSLPAIGGGSAGTASFRSRFWPIYRSTIQLALQRSDPATAMATMRRARRRQRLEFSNREERRQRVREAESIQELVEKAEGLSGAERERALQDLGERRAVYRSRFLTPQTQPGSAGEEPLMLDAGDLFTAYVVGVETSAVLWRLGAGELQWAQLPIGEQQLMDRISELVELLSRPAGPVQERRRSRRLEELSALLLAPLEGSLASSQRLLLSLDGPLHRLPWAALPSPSGGALVERLQLVRLPNLGTDAAAGDRSIELRTVIAADPTPDSLIQRTLGGNLERLPAARREAAAIAQILGARSTVFQDRAASEAAVLEAAALANVIHLAAHTRADERFPLESAVFLASDEHSDGVLRAWELIEAEALGELELVVLSGCESALGRDYPGQGFLGLVDAFFSAGARRVMASLWRVNDDSTAALMSEFYGALASGSSPEAALRRAQLSLLRGEHGEALRDPFHWAAFALNLAGN